MRAHAPGSWRAETCRARQGVCVVERGQTTARVRIVALDAVGIRTATEGSSRHLHLPGWGSRRVQPGPPRPCAPPRLVHGYRYSRPRLPNHAQPGPPRAAATRSGPIDRYADIRDRQQGPHSQAKFPNRSTRDRARRRAQTRDVHRADRCGQRTHAVHQRVARSFRRRVGASRDGGYFWTALEHA